MKAFDWTNLKFRIYDEITNEISGSNLQIPWQMVDASGRFITLPYSGHNTFDGREVYHGDIVTYKWREWDKWHWGRLPQVVLVSPACGALDTHYSGFSDSWVEHKAVKILGNALTHVELLKELKIDNPFEEVLCGHG